ncbi:hypothetical protein TanjilG_32222 [Lupinus angustifolius]|uniref:Phospholipase A1 n=1 Tax=Lupinus angustifolius TaxID=3871 RepID=A0A4P1RFG7_LUPAN|nr:hypothetical protein TanjilG_32222 [Lupinus angustifolius]
MLLLGIKLYSRESYGWLAFSYLRSISSFLSPLFALLMLELLVCLVGGDNLGVAVATLNAVDIAANGYIKDSPMSVFVFASLGVSVINFKRLVAEYNDMRINHVENVLDVVPNYPPLGYFIVGEGLMINPQNYGYLKLPRDINSWHSLEAYLHGIARTQGANINRDIVLVIEEDKEDCF